MNRDLADRNYDSIGNVRIDGNENVGAVLRTDEPTPNVDANIGQAHRNDGTTPNVEIGVADRTAYVRQLRKRKCTYCSEETPDAKVKVVYKYKTKLIKVSSIVILVIVVS